MKIFDQISSGTPKHTKNIKIGDLSEIHVRWPVMVLIYMSHHQSKRVTLPKTYVGVSRILRME